jgi:Fur family iron response transcriptional regulator
MRTKIGKEQLSELLASCGIRPTRQRLALASLLFDGGPKHLTAEQVHKSVHKAHLSISLATVYNNLHAFTKAGLLREISIDSVRSYFDTNQETHFHFFDEVSGCLEDIPARCVKIERLPKPPSGRKIAGMEVIVRLTRSS